MSLSIVIPAYNEAQRLPKTLQVLEVFCSQEPMGPIREVIVVNDGSTDNTEAVVRECLQHWPLLKLISLEKNLGKGAAVHRGLWQAASDFVLIADADMATPWEELFKLIPMSANNDLVMGSRGLEESEIMQRQHWFRQNMGKTFNKILKTLLGIPFHDTQCGFKLLRNDSDFRSEVLPYLQIHRFAWDVELILLLLKKKKSVSEVPIRWQHQEHSHVHIIYDSCEMFWSVLMLKWRLLLGNKTTK